MKNGNFRKIKESKKHRTRELLYEQIEKNLLINIQIIKLQKKTATTEAGNTN